MHGEAAPPSCRQRLAPACLARHQLHHAPEPPGVERVRLEAVPVVPRLTGESHLAHVHDAVGAEQLQQELPRVLSRGMRQFVDERPDGEGMRDVDDRPVPADACVGRRRPHLRLVVGHRIGKVGHALSHFPLRLVQHVGREQRTDRGQRRSLQPRRHPAIGVDSAFQVLGSHGVIEVVLDVIFPGPHHLHRRTHFLRQQRRLDDIVGLGLPSEPAAQQRHVRRHVLHWNAQHLGHRLARGTGILGAGPGVAAAILEDGKCGRRFHRCVRQVREVVVGGNARRGSAERAAGVALRAHDLARLARRLLQLRAELLGVVGPVGPVGPGDLELLPALHRRPGARRDDGHATQRLERGRRARLRQPDDPLDARPPSRLHSNRGSPPCHRTPAAARRPRSSSRHAGGPARTSPCPSSCRAGPGSARPCRCSGTATAS